MNSAPPNDPDWTAQLEKERQEEIQVIGGACDSLGREIFEVSRVMCMPRRQSRWTVSLKWSKTSIIADDRSHLMDIVCSMQSRISSIY